MKYLIALAAIVVFAAACKKTLYPSKIGGKYHGYKICQTVLSTQVLYDTSYLAVIVDQPDAEDISVIDSISNQYIAGLLRPTGSSYPYYFSSSDSSFTAYFDTVAHQVHMTLSGNCSFNGSR